MSRRRAVAIDDLCTGVADALVEETGVPRDQALRYAAPMVGYLQREFGGREVWVPRLRRTYPVAEMRALLERTGSFDKVCNAYNVSRRTLYRLLQGDR